MRIRFSAFNREWFFELDSRKLRKKEVIGYSSRCQEGSHIIIGDLDKPFKLEWLEAEIRNIQEEFELGNFYLFDSGGGWHFVCLDKVTYSGLIEILRHTSVDPYHILVPTKWGEKLLTLRVSEKNGKKPTFVKTLSSKWNEENEKSRMHTILLNNLFDLNISMDNLDNSKTLIGAKYRV